MRRLFASAMLCLLLLLSVGTARCEAQCAAAAMPMALQPALASDDAAMSMNSGMEHCGGMQSGHAGMAVMDAGCDTSLCGHQALPASSDSRIDVDTHSLQQVVLAMSAPVVVLPTHHARDGVTRPPRLQRSPLDQSSSLRV